MKILELKPTLDDYGNQLCYVYLNTNPPLNDILKWQTRLGKSNTIHTILSGPLLSEAEAVAIIDDDIELPERYDYNIQLKLLLGSSGYGAVSGNRYFSNVSNLPSAARHLWGEFARPLMKEWDIPWGGFLAMRKDVADKMMPIWIDSIWDDAHVARVTKELGYKFCHSEELSKLEDSSSCTWSYLWEFLIRQYADVSSGPSKVRMRLLWFFTLVPTINLPIISLWTLLLYPILWLFVAKKRTWRTLLAIPIVHYMFLIAFPIADMAKRIKWRGEWVDVR